MFNPPQSEFLSKGKRLVIHVGVNLLLALPPDINEKAPGAGFMLRAFDPCTEILRLGVGALADGADLFCSDRPVFHGRSILKESGDLGKGEAHPSILGGHGELW